MFCIVFFVNRHQSSCHVYADFFLMASFFFRRKGQKLQETNSGLLQSQQTQRKQRFRKKNHMLNVKDGKWWYEKKRYMISQPTIESQDGVLVLLISVADYVWLQLTRYSIFSSWISFRMWTAFKEFPANFEVWLNKNLTALRLLNVKYSNKTIYIFAMNRMVKKVTNSLNDVPLSTEWNSEKNVRWRRRNKALFYSLESYLKDTQTAFADLWKRFLISWRPTDSRT